jgi:hypothetical protein
MKSLSIAVLWWNASPVSWLPPFVEVGGVIRLWCEGVRHFSANDRYISPKRPTITESPTMGGVTDQKRFGNGALLS